VPQVISLIQALDSALRSAVMERDSLFLVMMVTTSMAMVAVALAKSKVDFSVLEDHLLPRIPAAKTFQLKYHSPQVGNPINGEE
jgi:hypothetical protein